MGRVHRTLSRFLPASTMTIGVELDDGAIFIMPASDSYWGSYLLDNQEYGPEIRRTLLDRVDMDFLFLDAGANYGYWSVLASSKGFGNHACLAIKTDPQTGYNFLAVRPRMSSTFYRRM